MIPEAQERQTRKAIERIPLIGREEEIERIVRAYQEATAPRVFYIEGEGGVGKTALMEEVMRRIRVGDDTGSRWGVVARQILDVYHIEYQTPGGLADGIIQVLQSSEDDFRAYKTFAQKLDERLAKGESVSQAEIDEGWKLFAEALDRLAESKGRLFLAIDTVEVLFAVQDEFQKEYNLALPSSASVLQSIFKIIQQSHAPILWLFAGRPSGLAEEAKTVGVLAEEHMIRLKPLGREEAVSYLRAVARQILDPAARERLEEISSYHASALHRETQGRPILLAIVADIVAQGGALPESFYRKEEETKRGRAELERRLLAHLVRLSDGIGDLLRVMGLLRKGVDASMLADLEGGESKDTALEEVQEHLLQRAAKLTIVKHRPVKERAYFLHDEVYALFERHSDYLPPQQARERYLEAVLRYYKERRGEIQEKAHHTWNWQTRVRLKRKAQWLEAEMLHYKLRLGVRDGYSFYFLRAEDALDARERDEFLQLRSELLRTVNELHQLGRLSKDVWQEAQIDVALRWGLYTLLVEGTVKRAIELLDEVEPWLRRKAESLSQNQKRQLQLYQAVAQLKDGNREDAQKILRQLDEELQDEQGRIAQIIKAYAAAYQGYLERLQGQYYQAIKHYQRAVSYFRRLKMHALTTTLANMAYAMAMVGWFRRARQALAEAETDARRSGNIHQRARILNVRCIVETLDGHLNTARRRAEEALELLDKGKLDAYSLRALIYVNLARARRYAWNRVVTDERVHEWKALWEAYDAIRKAEGYEVSLSLPYQVELWNEAGCVFREMSWLSRQRAEKKVDMALSDSEEASFVSALSDAGAKAQQYFLKAAGVSVDQELGSAEILEWEHRVQSHIEKVGDPYWPLMALVNLGWHWYYQRQPSEWIEALCQLIYRRIPEEYHLPEPKIKRGEAHILLWGILGKIEMLSFYDTLRGWKHLSREEREQRLRDGVRHVVWALEYDHLMGEDPYDLRRAEEGLNHRILTLPDWEECLLPRLYQYGEPYAKELEKNMGIQQSTFMQWLEERFGGRELWK